MRTPKNSGKRRPNRTQVGFNQSKKPCKKCLRRKALIASDYCEDCWAEFVARYSGQTGNIRTERVVVRLPQPDYDRDAA